MKETQTAELHRAAANGDLKTLRRLVTEGWFRSALDINATDTDGATPLHLAVAHGHGELVQFLLSHGASVDSLRHDGATALEIAVGYGSVRIAELLREHGSTLTERSGAILYSLLKTRPSLTCAQEIVALGGSEGEAVAKALSELRATIPDSELAAVLPASLIFVEAGKPFRVVRIPEEGHTEETWTANWDGSNAATPYPLWVVDGPEHYAVEPIP